MNLKTFFQSAIQKKQNPQIEMKNLKTTSLLSFNQFDTAQWSGRDYLSLAQNGFEQNVVAYRCIRMISEAGAFVPLRCFENGEEVTSHPVLNLLENPNKEQSLPDFLEKIYAYLQVSGNAFIERVVEDGRAVALFALRPDRVSVRVDDNGWPTAYDYQLDGRTISYVLPSDGASPIFHHRLFHPANDHYGISPLAVAGKSIDIHNGASAWNKGLFDNMARPSGALLYKGPEGAPNMTEEQFGRLKAELEENYQGAQNAGRPLLLEGGLDWLPLSLSPQDMDFIEAKNLAAREIALAFGVPPMLLGIPGDNTYANYAEANRAFWRQTVLPMVHRCTRAFGKWLAETKETNLVVSPDLNAIPALSEERGRLWQRIGDADFLTMNEKRAALGYGSVDGGDVLPKKRKNKNEN